MQAGKLRHKARILQPTAESTSRADTEYTYDTTSPPKYTYCSIEPLQGRELLFAQQIRADLTVKITMRYRADITHQTVLRWKDNKGIEHDFHLGPAVNQEMRNREIAIYAYEIK